MLIGFSVGNYRSFKNEETISLQASKISRHKNHLIELGNKKLLKSSVIFGANASGKTNLIKAVSFSKKIIIEGLESVNTEKRYFRLDKNGEKQPGFFEYRIMVGEQEYYYGIAISYYKREILGEWLIKTFKNGSEKHIFYREVDDDNNSKVDTEVAENTESYQRFKFYLDDFGNNISDAYRKKTILCDIALRSNEQEGILAEISKVYDWFKNIIILYPESQYTGLNEMATYDEDKKMLTNLMKYFDTGVESITNEKKVLDFEEFAETVPKALADKIQIDLSNDSNNGSVMFRVDDQFIIVRKNKSGNIEFNKLLLNHGNDDDYFDYTDESDGTKRLLDLIPLHINDLDKRVILIDEIDRSLHTNLTKQFFCVFFELTEHDCCQILATTHDSNLMDLDLFRQDEIWFVEREDDHSSTLFSLNRFKERFDKKVNKEYLMGRYGAIPVFKEYFINDRSDNEQ